MYASCIPAFFTIFIMKDFWVLSNAILAFSEMIMFFGFIFVCFILFQFAYICHITLMGFHMLKYSCIPWIKLIWSWWMVSLMFLWIQFKRIILNIKPSKLIREIGMIFSFFVKSLHGLGHGIFGLILWVWKWSFCYYIMESFEEYWH